MSNSTSDPNAETSTLDATAEVRENLNYIEKFGLPASVYIDSRLILNDVYIEPKFWFYRSEKASTSPGFLIE